MEVRRPAFLPDPSVDRETMERQQRAIADAATFADDLAVAPADVALEDPIVDTAPTAPGEGPTVVGVDQAFSDEAAISVAVAIQGDRVVELSVGREPLELPYIPGLLAFREAGAIVAALEGLSVDPAILVLDGSGRIHYRQAGIATHVGVLFDVPAIGVAKALLCGDPARSVDEPMPEGTRLPVFADDRVDAPSGTVIGYAYQSRQFARPARRHVNPLYVSPGHRVGAATTVEFVAALAAGYKLPEPTRLADALVDDYKD
ncbi:MAG: endonuclease V [Halanaeroarchaeum sp.]